MVRAFRRWRHESISEKYADKLKVCKLHIINKQRLIIKLRAYRCVIFNGGEEVTRIVGFRSEDALVDELKKHIEL